MSKQTELLNLTDGLSVDASGNVGIGTDAPAAKLVVSDTTGAIVRIESTKDGTWTDGESFGALEFYGSDTSGTGPGVRAGIEAVSAGTFGLASSLLFKYNNGGGPAVEAMRIASSGVAWIGGSTMPAGVAGIKLNIIGGSNDLMASYSTSTAAKTHWLFNNPNGTVGTIRTSASTTTYNTSSDYRLKENITPIQGAADIVKTMRPVTYTFKAAGDWADGFIAHELQELHPVAVSGEKDAMRDEEYEVTPAVLDEEGNVVTEAVMGTRSVPDYQGVDYSKLTPILTAALQEALNKIDALEAQNAAFETRLTALEAV